MINNSYTAKDIWFSSKSWTKCLFLLVKYSVWLVCCRAGKRL